MWKARNGVVFKQEDVDTGLIILLSRMLCEEYTTVLLIRMH